MRTNLQLIADPTCVSWKFYIMMDRSIQTSGPVDRPKKMSRETPDVDHCRDQRQSDAPIEDRHLVNAVADAVAPRCQQTAIISPCLKLAMKSCAD